MPNAAVKTVAGMKIRWAFARVGSIPTVRTIRSNRATISQSLSGQIGRKSIKLMESNDLSAVWVQSVPRSI
jgi:hypothetical protein